MRTLIREITHDLNDTRGQVFYFRCLFFYSDFFIVQWLVFDIKVVQLVGKPFCCLTVERLEQCSLHSGKRKFWKRKETMVHTDQATLFPFTQRKTLFENACAWCRKNKLHDRQDISQCFVHTCCKAERKPRFSLCWRERWFCFPRCCNLHWLWGNFKRTRWWHQQYVSATIVPIVLLEAFWNCLMKTGYRWWFRVFGGSPSKCWPSRYGCFRMYCDGKESKKPYQSFIHKPMIAHLLGLLLSTYFRWKNHVSTQILCWMLS